MTESDFKIAYGNCRISGYSSMSKFVRDRVCVDMKPRKTREVTCSYELPEWLKAEVEILTQQVRGVAKNYNQVVTVMNTVIQNAEKRNSQREVLRRMNSLNVYTKEMIDKLQEIKGVLSKLTPKEVSGEPEEGALP